MWTGHPQTEMEKKGRGRKGGISERGHEYAKVTKGGMMTQQHVDIDNRDYPPIDSFILRQRFLCNAADSPFSLAFREVFKRS
jgi:hypothetical protein